CVVGSWVPCFRGQGETPRPPQTRRGRESMRSAAASLVPVLVLRMLSPLTQSQEAHPASEKPRKHGTRGPTEVASQSVVPRPGLSHFSCLPGSQDVHRVTPVTVTTQRETNLRGPHPVTAWFERALGLSTLTASIITAVIVAVILVSF